LSRHAVEIVKSVEKQLDRFLSDLRKRMIAKILNLEETPRPVGVQKLQGTDYYRIRLGDYRVIYSIDDSDKLVRVLDIGHRREVYRKY